MRRFEASGGKSGLSADSNGGSRLGESQLGAHRGGGFAQSEKQHKMLVGKLEQ